MREVQMILLGFVAILALIWFISVPEFWYGHRPVAITSTS
jgi:hypothetical protein